MAIALFICASCAAGALLAGIALGKLAWRMARDSGCLPDRPRLKAALLVLLCCLTAAAAAAAVLCGYATVDIFRAMGSIFG